MNRWRKYNVIMWAVLYISLTLLAINVDKVCADPTPSASIKYRKPLTAEARRYWGLDAPIPLFAGQIHQESMWRPEARSKYAIGLTQFTPPTAGDMNKWYRGDLRSLQTYSPLWAMRAMVLYDKRLFENVHSREKQDAEINRCDRYAMMLAGYNGGAGWVSRDRRYAAENGHSQDKWFGSVEKFSTRAAWAFHENREYVVKIIFKHQQIYYGWGGEIVC